MIRKMEKSKKAISPILATLLLVVIAVAAIVVTYAWIMAYMSSANQQIGPRLERVNVRFYNESGVRMIDIDISNIGSEGTTIVAVYAGTSTSTLENQDIGDSLDLPNDGKVYSIRVTYNWTNGAMYYFRVHPSKGQDLAPWPEQAPMSG